MILLRQLLLGVGIAAWSTSLLADTLVLPPSRYLCQSAYDHCQCTQTETPYFPTTYTIQTDCRNIEPFELVFIDARAKDIKGPHQDPLYPPEPVHAEYRWIKDNITMFSTSIESLIPMYGNQNGNWTWEVGYYNCFEPRNAQKCPFILPKLAK